MRRAPKRQVSCCQRWRLLEAPDADSAVPGTSSVHHTSSSRFTAPRALPTAPTHLFKGHVGCERRGRHQLERLLMAAALHQQEDLKNKCRGARKHRIGHCRARMGNCAVPQACPWLSLSIRRKTGSTAVVSTSGGAALHCRQGVPDAADRHAPRPALLSCRAGTAVCKLGEQSNGGKPHFPTLLRRASTSPGAAFRTAQQTWQSAPAEAHHLAPAAAAAAGEAQQWQGRHEQRLWHSNTTSSSSRRTLVGRFERALVLPILQRRVKAVKQGLHLVRHAGSAG